MARARSTGGSPGSDSGITQESGPEFRNDRRDLLTLEEELGHFADCLVMLLDEPGQRG